MVETFDRFGKEFASGGIKTPIAQTELDDGFNYLGNAPPTKEQWNALFRDIDWKDNYLFNQMKTVIGLLPSSSGYTLGAATIDLFAKAIRRLTKANSIGPIATGTRTLTTEEQGIVQVHASAALSIVLPAPVVTNGIPMQFTLIRTDGATNFPVTVTASGGSMIEEASSFVLRQFMRVTFVTDPSMNRWRISASHSPDGLLIGEIKDYAGSTCPQRYLPCDGRTVSRITYAELFAAIGTTYGAGNGSSSFHLPNRLGRVPVGADPMFGVSGGNVLGSAAPIGSRGGSATVALTADQNGPHIHAAFTDLQGAHSHSGTTDSQGNHSHAAWTDLAGGHTHNGWTDVQGNHSHANVPQFLPGGDSDRGIGNHSFFSLDNEGQTSVSGAHQHNVSVDTQGVHGHQVGMAGIGGHVHNLVVNVAPAHQHAVGMNLSGSGAPHSNLSPYETTNFIIYAGV